jgi:hypothetical protein
VTERPRNRQWVNVGEWAVRELHLTCDQTDPRAHYPNHGISPLQRDRDYDQHVP